MSTAAIRRALVHLMEDPGERHREIQAAIDELDAIDKAATELVRTFDSPDVYTEMFRKRVCGAAPDAFATLRSVARKD